MCHFDTILIVNVSRPYHSRETKDDIKEKIVCQRMAPQIKEAPEINMQFYFFRSHSSFLSPKFSFNLESM